MKVVSYSFKYLKHFVSYGETLCFKAWNTLFQGMKHFVPKVETTVATTSLAFCYRWYARMIP